MDTGATIVTNVTTGGTITSNVVSSGDQITSQLIVGAAGEPGQGVPTGGSSGQFLKKNSATNYDDVWAFISQSDVAGLVATLAALAPLSSPSLTGIPTAPTAAGGTNSIQIATTAFVAAAVAGVPSAPVTSVAGKTGAVVLVEGDITGLVSDLAAKLSKSGGTMTGALEMGANELRFSNTANARIFNDGNLHIDSGSNNMWVDTLTGNIYLISSGSGMVGIGTSSPSAKLHVVGDEIIQENVTVQKNDGSRAYRFRTNGGALDFETAGSDLYLSMWSGAGFTGTQYNMIILHGGGGMVEFTTSIEIDDAKNIQLGTSTGTKIGTATGQKMGFFNATPVVQQSGDVAAALQALGLVASATYSIDGGTP